MFSLTGFPLEISIAGLLIKLRLSALMVNQLLIAKRLFNKFKIKTNLIIFF